MNKPQLMFIETQEQVLNCLKSRLMGTHAYWQILLMADASLTIKAVCVAESMLQSHNLQEGTELTDTEVQADTFSMFDSLV